MGQGQTLLAFVIIVVFKRKTNQRVGLLVLVNRAIERSFLNSIKLESI